MTKPSRNAPAFPVPVEGLDEKWRGMSLRDYFAANSLPALIADYCASARTVGFDEDWHVGMAMDAYRMADAMLKARGAQ